MAAESLCLLVQKSYGLVVNTIYGEMVPEFLPETRNVNISEQTLERTTALQEPIHPSKDLLI